MTRPRLARDVDFLPGLAAVALFGVLALASLNAALGDATGFGGDAALMRSIGAAMFNLDAGALAPGASVPGEGFLVAFEIVDVVIVAALVASIMLARRDVRGGQPAADGGRTAEDDGSTAQDDGSTVADDGTSASAGAGSAGAEGAGGDDA